MNCIKRKGLRYGVRIHTQAFSLNFWLAAKAASHILGPFSDTESYFRRSSSLGDFIRHA